MIRMLSLIFLLLPVYALAFQPPQAPDSKPGVDVPFARPTALIPKREVRFEVSTEELPLTLFEADPKLLEQRYVAEVKLRAASHHGLRPAPYPGGVDGELILLYRSVTPPFERGAPLEQILNNIRKTRMPADKSLEPLATDARFLLLGKLSVEEDLHRDWQTYGIPYQVLAPTPERAKELTHALLTLFDRGVTEPIQEQVNHYAQGTAGRIAAANTEWTAAQKERDALKEQMANADVLEPAAISDLKTQRRLLEVDLAGVKARIDACEAILARGNLNPARREQVENVKITGEIELAGLAARQKTLDRIVDQSQAILTLRSQFQRADAKVSRLQNQIAGEEQQLGEYKRRMEAYGPFRLIDDKVVIRPIKWEKKP